MWRVYPSENFDLLKAYHEKILKPFFDFVIELKATKCFGKNAFVLTNEPWKQSSVLPPDFPHDIFYTTNGEVIFEKEIGEIIAKLKLSDIKKEKQVFEYQNDHLFNLEILRPVTSPESFYKIFSKIFYEKLFDSDDCWKYIGRKTPFKRKDFFRNYRKANRSVCPLCDIDTINAKSNSIVEHFLPRNLYPYLSLNPFNLIATCNACNKAEEGKGTKVYIPIAFPYQEQIGEQISFSIDSNGSNKIILEKHEKDLYVNNFLKTLKLPSRYATEEVANPGILKVNSDISMINALKNIMSIEDAINLTLNGREGDGYYFFRKQYLGSYS